MSKELFNYAEFYKFLENKKFMGTQCKACKKVYCPPRPICTECFSDDMEWVELSGKAKLLTFTCINVGPTFMSDLGYDRKNPFCSGIVALEEGPQMSGLIMGVDAKKPETIKIGLPLKVEILERGEGETRQLWWGFKAEA
jgi:uncharacterized OB-fold protein